MRLRRLLAGAATGLGLLAASNRAIAARAEPLDPALDGRQRTVRWRGMNVAYTEAGDPDAPDVVLLHGVNAAGSSGEFRAVFDDLARDYHVVAPDLPGFGRSDRPAMEYRPELYEAFVASFLARFERPTVVASSLTAAFVTGALADAALDVARLLYVCPTTTGGPPANRLLRDLFRSPVVGESLFNLLTSRPAIRYFNADHGYYDTSVLSADWVDYEWQTAHQPNARYPAAAFVSGYLNSDVDLGGTLADVGVPVTFVWGREASVTPLSDGRELAATADARLVVFDDTKLLPHVEFPARFVDVVREELSRTAGTPAETGDGP
jgi:pimeloyl-ACP methyl ester carboxylesterase